MAVCEPHLYRGKRVDKNHEWVYGPYYEIKGNLVEIWTSVNSLGGREHYVIDPKTFGQSIGIQDVNSTEIFDGDILKITSSFGIWKHFFIDKIVYDNRRGTIGLYLKNRRETLFIDGLKPNNDNRNVEIVGNIYDTQNHRRNV